MCGAVETIVLVYGAEVNGFSSECLCTVHVHVYTYMYIHVHTEIQWGGRGELVGGRGRSVVCWKVFSDDR